ncbi:Serine/threonine protein kinase [Lachnospiraceae bacterium NE2001]|nr:Serine/threonine protein kinase [Lachnospiraceae bacterium NE2001]
MDAVSYINKTYTILSDISPKNYAKLARNNIDGKLYVLKYLKAYDLNVYKELQKINVINISRIYEVLDSPNGLYVVEEYIEGCTLEERFVKEQNIGFRGSLLTDLIRQLLTGLEYIHGLPTPIIHRDIKPENILVTNENLVKLIDFNISRYYTGNASRDTVAMGTNSFAAPEQYGFFESDPRTDIYGVGATAKYIMDRFNIKEEHLVQFVNKAMAFDPKERFNSAAEARYFLQNYYKIKSENEKKILEEERANSWRRFLPPGFRKGKPSHIITACFAYLIMFIHTFSTIVASDRYGTYSKGQYALACIMIWAWFILITFFSFDYLGVQKIFKINELSGGKKIVAILGVDLLMIIITAIIGAFFVNKV